MVGQAATEALTPEASPPSVTAGPDIFLADGSETALAVDFSNANILAAALNSGYLDSPSLLASSDGNLSWASKTFPNGAGTINGQAFNPWAAPGNTTRELFTSLVRRDTATGSVVTHMILARSTNGGSTWSRLFEVNKQLVQDRGMFDVDRTMARGGGVGTSHDGELYLAYDGYDTTPQKNYVGSYLQVVSPAGNALGEITTTLPFFIGVSHGSQMQPVAATVDGQVDLMATAPYETSDTLVIVRKVTVADGSVSTPRYAFHFATVGQQLGTSGHWGLNGHRLGSSAQMAIDHSNGVWRGSLYVLSAFNPNPGDPTKDQGDLALSISYDDGDTWAFWGISGPAAGKTQFFPMIDVDEDGWIHVAYYQNETGLTDNGVLNASTANLYYTVSSDGGQTWSPHTRVNGDSNTLHFVDPPLDLSAQDYYLIGDYATIRAGKVAGTRVAYVLWSGYDKSRTDTNRGDKRDRAICTMMTPALDSDGDGLLDPQDNCPMIFNPYQEDYNGNGVGDICECLLTRANLDKTASSQYRIDGSDLFPMARAFGTCSYSPTYSYSVDLSPDGCIDGYDLAILASLWAKQVPMACP